MEKEIEKESLTDVLLPLQETNSTENFIKLWQKLMDSARDMDMFYEESRESIFQFKNLFDKIRQTEQLNDALRHVYYDALATKKKHEEDRDHYFQCDKELAELKNNFVAESQKLALKNSKYVEYSHRFALRREELFSYFLAEFARICDENSSLKQDKIKLTKENVENKLAAREMRDKVSELESSLRVTNEHWKSTEEKRDYYKKEAEWTKRQNNKLADSKQRLEKALEAAKKETEALQEQKSTQEANETALKQHTAQLTTRCLQLQELLKSNSERITQLQEQARADAEVWKKEKFCLTKELNEAKTKMNAARENNHKTLLKNRELRENLSLATRKIDKVTREKLRSVLRENRTQHDNTELVSQHLLLINEVLELKNDFLSDQAQIREGAKLNRKLKIDVQLLEQKVQMLKENTLKFDPLLDGAAEHRKQLLRKYGAKKTDV